VQRDPNNNDLRLDLAQLYLDRGEIMGVFEQAKVVLERDPRNSRGLFFGGLVRMQMGDGGAAEQMFLQSIASDPRNLNSRVGLAMVYAQTDRMSDADKAIAEAVKLSPENKANLERVLAEIKANARQMAQGASGMPEGHPPVDGQPAGMTAAAPSPAAAAGPSIKVTLQLDAAAKSKTGIVFVIARPLTGGPPVAVKRMQVASFPITFDLSSADSMMGQPLPPKFRLEARLDSDGDASTKPPTDPSAMQAEVNSGAAVTLALK
jgi:tetratricopeptide (TPR) repeat protein